MEKHELSKIDFEVIDAAFKALLQSSPDPVHGLIKSPICGTYFGMPTLAGSRSTKTPLTVPLSRSLAALGEGQKFQSAGSQTGGRRDWGR